MGEARKRELKARDEAFAKSPNCIFCGGLVPATTVDHCPPRNIFVDRQWPEGFVFPACHPCNFGSSAAESILGFLARMNSAKTGLPSETAKLGRDVDMLYRKYPADTKALATLPTSAKRRMARDIGFELPPGGVYRDLPFVELPQSWVDMVMAFAVKLTKAIHFHETGRICPPNAHVWVTFIPNAVEYRSPLPDQFFAELVRIKEIERASQDLSDQFSYVGQRSPEGTSAMYMFSFNQSFKLLCCYGDDGDMIRQAEREFDSGERSASPQLAA